MGDVLKLLELLSGNPSLILGASALLVLLFILKPFSKRIDAAANNWIVQGGLSAVIPRLALFITTLHGLIATVATLWCYFVTDFPAPFASSMQQHPWGPSAIRLSGYGISIMCSFAALMPIIGKFDKGNTKTASSDSERIDVFMRAITFLVPVGMLIAAPLVTYAVFVDPTIVTSVPPPTATGATLWWYASFSVFSFAAGAYAWVLILALRWLWRQTA
jgi:hypothetical protein